VAYEWDPNKAAENLRKHGVSFGEAASVLLDPTAMTFDDPDHSDGVSVRRRILFVTHCWRKNRIRIITARRATRREKDQYEKRIGPNQ